MDTDNAEKQPLALVLGSAAETVRRAIAQGRPIYIPGTGISAKPTQEQAVAFFQQSPQHLTRVAN